MIDYTVQEKTYNRYLDTLCTTTGTVQFRKFMYKCVEMPRLYNGARLIKRSYLSVCIVYYILYLEINDEGQIFGRSYAFHIITKQATNIDLRFHFMHQS